MCGSAEGPTPEQLAHPPPDALGRLLLNQLYEIEKEQIQRARTFYELGFKPVVCLDRFITVKVRRGT